MKTKQILILLFIGSSIILQAQTKVVIDPNIQHQEIEGWGSSLCWWAKEVGKWKNEAKIDQIIDFITSPDKMNMNIFRYNIGGGDHPDHYSKPGEPGHMANGKGERAEMEGFWPGKEEDYDWTKDAGQIRVLRKLHAKREDIILEAFSNSPPYWMTHSGCSSGIGTLGELFTTQTNLKSEHYDDFCKYLIDVCKHIKESYGIEFRTLEPFNEPNSLAWFTTPPLGGTQEGCHFKPAAQMDIIRLMHAKLQESGLNTVISASDETNISTAVNTTKDYINAGDIMPKIAQINVHTYSGSDKNRSELQILANEQQTRLWQSESGPMNITGSGLQNHLKLSQRLIDDMKIMKPVAWLDWQFMEEGNLEWSQINGSFKDEVFNIGKNAYVRMQITRFIKQGYTLIENDHKSILTAISPNRTELVIVVLNVEEASVGFDLDLTAFYNPLPGGKAYRTSASANCQEFRMPAINDKELSFRAPQESITTFVIPLGIDYESSPIFKGIGFDEGLMDDIESKSSSIVINPENQKVNKSNRVLLVHDTIQYKFRSHFAPSDEYRYLHIMTYTPDTNGEAQISDPGKDNEFALQPTTQWTDQVFDLNDCIALNELSFLIPTNISSFYVDDIVINNTPVSNPDGIYEIKPYELEYSNTIKGKLIIINLPENALIEVFTMQGVPVFKGYTSSSEQTLTLPSGIFIVKVKNESSEKRIKVVVK